MSYEKNIMACEVEIMELLLQYPRIPAARVVCYQLWDEECSAPYFFMERLAGKSLWSEKEHLSQEQIHACKVMLGRLLSRLEEEKEFFEEVTVPCLVHWDLWEGNVFVSGGKITGIIDWERALWADPLLKLGFRTYDDPADFLEGYGKREFSPAERRRVKWYNIYLMVLTALECDYRGYQDRSSYEYATGRLREEWENWERPAGFVI